MKYLLENCYFELGSNIFRQVTGVPMGSDTALFFANLFLFYCDSKWIKKVTRVILGKQGDLLLCSGSLITLPGADAGAATAANAAPRNDSH